jgi:tetratricopeptide (TPR) repeat protein
MQRLQNLVDVELEKMRVARELREKYERYHLLAKKAMTDADYDLALDYWEEMLDIFENDPAALAGKRRAELAINNRRVFEKVRQLFESATVLYDQKKYSEALSEFRQILELDRQNDEARDYISRINDEIEEQQNIEQRKQQAEQFYTAGLEALNVNDFRRARENFENAMGMVRDYKDSRQRIEGIAGLEKEYQERLRRQRLEEIDREFQSGLVFLSERKYREALAAFERTVRMDPDNEMVRKYIVTVKEALQQEQDEVIDRNSPYYDIVQAMIMSGRQLYGEGRYQESACDGSVYYGFFPRTGLPRNICCAVSCNLIHRHLKNLLQQ